jgi:hypothetical protein
MLWFRDHACAEPAVERDGYTALAGKGRTIIRDNRAGAVFESAALDPDQHRERGLSRLPCPDVQIQAVVALGHAPPLRLTSLRPCIESASSCKPAIQPSVRVSRAVMSFADKCKA